MSGHTPGAWQHGHQGDDFWVGPTWDGQHVARVHWEFGAIEDGRANAALIAAAPDLLAALERAESVIDPKEWPAAAEIVRAAIAKAKGAA